MPGQHQVEDHEVGAAAAHGRQGSLAVARLGDLVPAGAQVGHDDLAHGQVVVDDEHLSHAQLLAPPGNGDRHLQRLACRDGWPAGAFRVGELRRQGCPLRGADTLCAHERSVGGEAGGAVCRAGGGPGGGESAVAADPEGGHRTVTEAHGQGPPVGRHGCVGRTGAGRGGDCRLERERAVVGDAVRRRSTCSQR